MKGEGLCWINNPAGLAAYLDYDGEKSLLNMFLVPSALDRPDLAKIASPDNYIDKDDPPILIVHGDADGLCRFGKPAVIAG